MFANAASEDISEVFVALSVLAYEVEAVSPTTVLIFQVAEGVESLPSSSANEVLSLPRNTPVTRQFAEDNPIKYSIPRQDDSAMDLPSHPELDEQLVLRASKRARFLEHGRASLRAGRSPPTVADPDAKFE